MFTELFMARKTGDIGILYLDNLVFLWDNCFWLYFAPLKRAKMAFLKTLIRFFRQSVVFNPFFPERSCTSSI